MDLKKMFLAQLQREGALGAKHKMPRLADIEYVVRTRETDARPTVSALASLIQQMAVKAVSA